MILQDLRLHLGWVQQVDGFSCGPLATACCLTILQGIKPTWKAWGMLYPIVDLESSSVLRETLGLLLLLGTTTENGTANRFTDGLGEEFHSKLKLLWDLSKLSDSYIECMRMT